MKKAVGYLRRSTILQDQSIGDQKKAINQYAEQNDYEILKWFTDDGISGTGIENRDAFRNMISIVMNGNKDFDYILCYDISRFGSFPNSDESGYWEFHLRRYNAEVVFTNEPGLSSNRLANSVIKSVKRNAAGDFSRSAIVCLVLIFLIASMVLFLNYFGKDSQKTPQRTYQKSVKLISTDKGTFTPGQKAYIDGIDKYSKPALTVMNINIWSNPQQNKIRCKLSHGTKVTLETIHYIDNTVYFKVKSINCEGWISELFLSDKKNKPTGDLF